MAKYLLQGNYVGDGIGGLLKEGGSSRREAVENLVAAMGGSVEAVYYAFGPTDIYVIVDLPSHVDAAAASLVANASGAVSVSVTVLLTPEDIDEAGKKSPDYRPPGS